MPYLVLHPCGYYPNNKKVLHITENQTQALHFKRHASVLLLDDCVLLSVLQSVLVYASFGTSIVYIAQ